MTWDSSAALRVVTSCGCQSKLAVTQALSTPDWAGSEARFVAKSHAELHVCVLLNGKVMAPGYVTFADNTGKTAVLAEWPRAASFEWAGSIIKPGRHTVEVQFRNARTWHIGGLTKWILVVEQA